MLPEAPSSCPPSICTLTDVFAQSTGIPSYLMTHEARLASERLLQEALAFSDELFNLREVCGQRVVQYSILSI